MGTNHILKQVEWFHKLKVKYHCVVVEMEYEFRIDKFKPRVDVYGRTLSGKIYIVEIGDVWKKKLKMLKQLTREGKIEFIHVSTGDELSLKDFKAKIIAEMLNKGYKFDIIENRWRKMTEEFR